MDATMPITQPTESAMARFSRMLRVIEFGGKIREDVLEEASAAARAESQCS